MITPENTHLEAHKDTSADLRYHSLRTELFTSSAAADHATESIPQTPQGRTPEARVLVVMTGGTICMQKSENGLVPARNFLDRCMAPRPEFNDGDTLDPIDVRVNDDPDGISQLKSLRTTVSRYGKRVR